MTKDITTRLAAGALLLAGPAAIAFHVVYGISHGPTVTNENREVLGLTNYEWGRAAILWMALAAFGMIGLGRIQRGSLARAATTIVLLGLLLNAGAAWIFDLYVPATLTLFLGLVLIAAVALRAGPVPAWAAVGPVVAVVAWLPFPMSPDAVYAYETSLPGIVLHGDDLVALAFGVAWIVLGAGLLAAGERGGAPGRETVGGTHPRAAAAPGAEPGAFVAAQASRV